MDIKKSSPRTHLTWSIEISAIKSSGNKQEVINLCPCGGEVALVVAHDEWRTADGEEYLSVNGEVSAHVCKECGKLVSLSLNIFS